MTLEVQFEIPLLTVRLNVLPFQGMKFYINKYYRSTDSYSLTNLMPYPEYPAGGNWGYLWDVLRLLDPSIVSYMHAFELSFAYVVFISTQA